MNSQMTDEDRKELLHKAYLQAIVAKAGFSNQQPEKDYGVDGYLYKVKKGLNSLFPSRIPLAYQLKASSSSNVYQIKESYVHFKLDGSAYNKLVDMYTDEQDCVLIVFCLPEKDTDWIRTSETELSIRQCCYWEILRETEHINQDSSKTIKIPRTQILDEYSLSDLIDKVNEGKRL